MSTNTAKLKSTSEGHIIVIPSINEQVLITTGGTAIKSTQDVSELPDVQWDAEIETAAYNAMRSFSYDYTSAELKFLYAFVVEKQEDID
jgi:hypothetical protein